MGEKLRNENKKLLSERGCLQLGNNRTPDRFQLVGGLTLSRPVKQLVRHQSLARDHYTGPAAVATYCTCLLDGHVGRQHLHFTVLYCQLRS